MLLVNVLPSTKLSLVTWKSHCIANGVMAWALTGRPEVAAAAMMTATLPDQLEALLPFGRHRGASHWLGLWLGLILTAPSCARREWSSYLSQVFSHHIPGWHLGGMFVGAVVFGLALGPFLHVLLDGCSDSGVPVLPFSRWRLKRGMYRTDSYRWRWDLSEPLFLSLLVAACAAFWRIHG